MHLLIKATYNFAAGENLMCSYKSTTKSKSALAAIAISSASEHSRTAEKI